MFDSGTVKDSSIWVDTSSRKTMNTLDGLTRIGIVKSAYNAANTGELYYIVEVQSLGKKINLSCRMMRRFGGVYNYEDFINRGYKTSDSPDPVNSFEAKAGDAVLVTQLNGQAREGVILGGFTHAARVTAIQATGGPQYVSEFNGMNTSINADGEWTLMFRGQPTNLSTLNDTPSGDIPAAVYDTAVGSSFMKFDKTGSWTISDNANSNPQSIKIDKANGTVTIIAGQISLTMTKGSQAVALVCKDLSINSSNSITEITKDYALTASSSAKFNSPQIAIGHDGIELLDQLSQLVTALGTLTAISPVGPCAPLSASPTWSQVQQIQSKINQIKGSL